MLELREEARFLHEAPAPGFERLLVLHRAQHDRVLVLAERELRGQVFLERDVTVQRVIEREVDDREPALAEDAFDLELEKPRAFRERVGVAGDVAALGRRGIVVHDHPTINRGALCAKRH
jgi:hypothetical protein